MTISMIARLAFSLLPRRGARRASAAAVACLVAALPAFAAPHAASAQQKTGAIPGLAGLDHVAIGVNDIAGALAAYRRLGFTVIPLDSPGAGGPGGIIDLGSGFLEFVAPGVDSLGKPQPYTFEGAIGQGWEIGSSKDVAAFLRGKGGETTAPVGATFALAPDSAGKSAAAPPGPTFTLSEPSEQPISGTAVYFVEYDQPKLRPLFDEIVRRSGVGDPTDHPNGAAELAYVTVVVSHLGDIVKVLRSWGLDPRPPVQDQRGAQTVEVPLPRGTLYLTSPTSNGGIDDFLEERRSKAPPVGSRYFEGSILSIGIGVADLNETIDWLTYHNVPYVPMDLPAGRVEVLQGAPGWGLRIELVQAGKDRSRQWAAHRGGQAASAAGAAGARAPAASSDQGGSQ
jgi:catechol 2,3-dioxygenase-like lactoylglutathione lyase family enzyme